MYGLLYKEFVLNKKYLLSLGVSLIFLSSLMFFPNDGYAELSAIISAFSVVCMFLVGGMLQQSIFEYDEKRGWYYFISSSPVTAKGQVTVKYCYIILISFLIHAWCFMVQLLSSAVLDTENCLSADILMGIVTVQIFLRSVELPFIFRFGSKYGNYFRMFMTYALVLAVVIYLLFGDISIFGSTEQLIMKAANFLMGENSSDVMLVFVCISPYVTLALYYLSYKISCSLYMKGVDVYDK